MTNNILFQVLQKLSTKELAQLRLFLQSPFFTTTNRFVILFDYLTTCIKDNQTPSKQEAYKKLFPSATSYKDQKVRLDLSDLLKLVEQFILHNEHKGSSAARSVTLSSYYRKIGLEKHFNRTHRKSIQELEKMSFKNSQFYSLKHQLQWELYEFEISKKRDADTNLLELGRDFDISYCSARLRQACFLKTQQAFSNNDYDFKWINLLIERIKDNKWLSIPAISLYYYAFHLYDSDSNANSFETLKQEILQHSQLFPPEELKDLYLLAINYCIRKVNSGEKEYLQESLDLYKAGLETQCFLEKGILSKFTYANIVANGLMVRDYEWVSHFINKYKNSLKKEERSNSFNFNMARLEYTSKKNYDLALGYLQKVNDKDLINTLNAKILQLRVYYEIHAFNLLESHLEAIANFIRRKEVIGYHKDTFLNTVKFTRKLLKLNPYDEEAKRKLELEIRNEPILLEREWLLAQIK